MEKTYELTCIISARPEETERNQIAEKIGKIIKGNDGKITAMTPPGPVNLGYPIKDEQKGYMAIFVFNYQGKKPTDIKNKAEKEQNILRCFLAIKHPLKPVAFHPAPPVEKERGTEKERKIEKQDIKENKKVELGEIDKKLEEIFNPKKNN
jgi:ribosomal protein S6